MLKKIFSSKLRERLKKYTGLEAQPFKDTMIGDMDFIEKYVFETILNEKVIKKRVKEKLLNQLHQSSGVPAGLGRIPENFLDRVLQLHYSFSLPERLKADNTV
ncbi:hypothetical protein Tco_0438002 [Tanacetum coccineum]